MSKISVLAKRELLSRLKSKGFWVATLVLPLVLGALFVLPGLIISRSQAEQVAVLVDETGRLGGGIAERLASPPSFGSARRARLSVASEPPAPDPAQQIAELNRRVLGGEIDAWIWIDRAGLAEDRVEYHAESVSNVLTQAVIRDAISSEVREMRLAEAGYDPAEVAELIRSVQLDTVRVTSEGGRAEAGEAGFLVAYGAFFLLYLTLMLWGQQVLTGVLEEKSSRIAEVIVSTARPFDLMMGKMIGIGLAGMTQLAVWLTTVAVLTAPGVATAVAALPDGVSIPVVQPAVAVHFLGFFVLGFLIFASLFAAIGAAFNNLQEAQHFTAIPFAFLMAPIMVIFPVINDPDSTLATVVSLLPIFSPVLMPVRIAVKMPPVWQVALAYLVSVGTMVVLIWLCGRIYRVGILMHGKKPTLAEIVRWLRYA